MSNLRQSVLDSLAYILGHRSAENSYRVAVDRANRNVIAKEVCVPSDLDGPSFDVALAAIDALAEVPRIMLERSGHCCRVASVDDLPQRLGMVKSATYGPARVSICANSVGDNRFQWVFEVAFEHDACGGPREVRSQ